MTTEKTQWKMDSEIGPLYLVATDQGLYGLYWWKIEDVAMARKLDRTSPALRILAQTVEQVEQYLKGQRQTFDLPLDPAQGTPFQKKVWAQLAKIPYGETRTYLDIARKINQPKACRAVGTANGKNPISIIVPCHRVIATGGGLGGFAGGLKTKTRLLELEKQALTGAGRR